MLVRTQREKLAIIVAVIFVIGYVVLEFGIDPYVARKQRAQRLLTTKKQVLQQMMVVKAQLEAMNLRAESARSKVTQRSGKFDLFKFLDEQANQAGLKDHIAYMKPSKTRVKDSPLILAMVEMKIQGVNFNQLTPYIRMVEMNENDLYIKRISITKKGTNSHVVDAVLQVETYEM